MAKSTSYEVIDDFLPIDTFNHFAFAAMTNYMYNPLDMVTNPEDTDGSLVNFGEPLYPGKDPATLMFQAHLLFRFINRLEVSDFFIQNPDFMETLENCLGVKKWWAARVNCTVIQPKQFIGAYHIDFQEPYYKNCETAILYMNTNNGGTKFEETGEIVQSKRNRLVRFPTHTRHAGVWSTDAKLRFVLNMTYETSKLSNNRGYIHT